MNRSVREVIQVKCKSALSGPEDWILRYIRTCLFFKVVEHLNISGKYFIMPNKLIFHNIFEKVLVCAHNVLVKSEYDEYESMRHMFYE